DERHDDAIAGRIRIVGGRRRGTRVRPGGASSPYSVDAAAGPPGAAHLDDLERGGLTVAGCDDLQQRAQRLGHAAVTTDDLSHIVRRDVELDDRSAVIPADV